MPAVDALAASYRVITFSLCDEPSSQSTYDAPCGIHSYLTQLEDVFTHAGLTDAVLIGVSYGGLIASEFAVRHPERIRALVLVSALPSTWEIDRRARFYLRAPRLLSPIFLLDSPLRTLPEIRAALPRFSDRLRFSAGQVARALQAFISPTRMAARLRWLADFSFSDVSQLRMPVLVITGEERLDRVVPLAMTKRYVDCIPGARHEVLANTGHLGLLTRPAAFATAVTRFVENTKSDARRIPA